jgi:integrase
MRRSNGAGGVFKLPGNRRKPWQARITVGWENGKQLYKTIGYYETKAKAEEAIALDRVMPVSEHAGITLSGLFEQWKKTRAYKDVSQSMRWNYDAAYKYYMEQYHNTPFRDLRLNHFQAMIDKADALHRSESIMQKIKALSNILSRYAKDQDIVFKTYSENTRLPNVPKKKKIETFSDTDIQKLFDNDEMPLVDTVIILIYTGLRIREMLSLTKFNVDLKNMIITGGMKTEAGTNRVIPIHPKIQKYIKARYVSAQNYLIEYDKEIGNKKRGNKKIVRSPYRYEYYRDLFYEVLEKLEINPPGIHRLTPHKARHTFVTRLSLCKDRKGKAIITGHTDPNFTEKKYDQPDIERLRKVIESME